MGKWKEFFLDRIITFRIDESTYSLLVRYVDEDNISKYIRSLIAKDLEEKQRKEQERVNNIKH